jgi:cytochrome c-type biogenesis protein CcmH
VTAFWISAALLAAVVLAWVLRPFVRPPRESAAPGRAHSNLTLLRDQLAELDQDLASGTLAAAQHREARDELERRTLEEGRTVLPQAGSRDSNAWRTVLVLAIVIPAAAALLYAQLGNLEALRGTSRVPAETQITPEQVEQMVAKLAARLEQQPDDVRGWTMLARSYTIMQRFDAAARAYARLLELIPNDVDVLVDYADALAMSQERNLSGQPIDLVKRALAIDPNHWKALAMAGTEAFDRKDYGTAVAYWERMRAVVPPGSEIAKSVEASIGEARALAGGVPPAATAARSDAGAGTAKVSGTVQVSPALAASIAPADTVFVFARAPVGGKMPVAVLRRTAKELPFAFTLDDTQAMAGNNKLSSLTEVLIGARISRTGNAAPQPGDLQGTSRPVKVGATNVAITIDEVVR